MSLDEKSKKLGEALARLRDGLRGLQPAIEAIDGFLSYLGESMEPTAVKEETFTILKFEKQTGSRLGEYEVAYKANNLEDKWNQAYNVLRQNNATINNRYYGDSYAFGYWLYGKNRIYRQKLKAPESQATTAETSDKH